MLVQFCYEKEARELQRQYEDFLKAIERSLPEIWIQEEESDTRAVSHGAVHTSWFMRSRVTLC